MIQMRNVIPFGIRLLLQCNIPICMRSVVSWNDKRATGGEKNCNAGDEMNRQLVK